MAEEKQYEEKIKKYLTSKGAYFFKYWGGGQYTRAGVPDIIACIHGRFVAIEVKASKGKPSPLQLYNLRLIDDAGGYALLLFPEDFDDFKKLIDMMYKREVEAYRQYFNMKSRWIKYGTQ